MLTEYSRFYGPDHHAPFGSRAGEKVIPRNAINRPQRRVTSAPLPTTRYRYQLAGVKDNLYHPHLPSLRRMDMDSVLCKLPNEHSRLSSPCSARHFKTLLGPPTTFHQQNKKLSLEPQMINAANEPNAMPLQDCYKQNSTEITNGTSSLISTTNAGRYTLREDPCIGDKRQRILPAAINERYRRVHTSSRYNGVSYFSWK